MRLGSSGLRSAQIDLGEAVALGVDLGKRKEGGGSDRKGGTQSIEERPLSQWGIDRSLYSVPLTAKSTPELPSGQGPGHYSASTC